MIRFLLGLFFILAKAYAGEQVSLLVAVKGKSGPLFHREETSQRLIEKFKRHYSGDPKNLNIIAEATQEDLHRELSNPENKALFWVSHANSFNPDSGLSNENVILDVEGNNVKDLFQKTHPGLRFLGVLGCRTAPIMKGLESQGYFQHNPELMVYAREKKINGMKEIRRALEAFEAQKESRPYQCPTINAHLIRLTRIVGENGKSLKVMNREKFLGLFPQGLPGSTQILEVYVPSPKSAHDLKLQIDTDGSSQEERDQIFIKSDAFLGEWKIFSDASGRPIGLQQNVYRYQGPIEPLQTPKNYSPFRCQQ